MAQLRQDASKFTERNAEILIIGPEKPAAFRDFFAKHDLPFIGLPDPEHSVLNRFGQEVRLLKLGRMPALVLIDRSGRVRFAHYGHSMADIPPNEELLAVLDRLNQEPIEPS